MSSDMLSSAALPPGDDAVTIVTSNCSSLLDQGRDSSLPFVPCDQGRDYSGMHLPLNAIDLDSFDCPPFDAIQSEPPVSPPEPQAPPVDDDPEALRAQLDTGAFVSCTGSHHLLHNYKPFTLQSPCPV